jgi:hypothetical protein
MMSPAEAMLELTNVDFLPEEGQVDRISTLVHAWDNSSERKLISDSILVSENKKETFTTTLSSTGYPRSLAMQTWILFHRMALVNPLDVFNWRNRIAIRLHMESGLSCILV